MNVKDVLSAQVHWGIPPHYNMVHNTTGLILGLHPANERQCWNDVSHWLGTNLESALIAHFTENCSEVGIKLDSKLTKKSWHMKVSYGMSIVNTSDHVKFDHVIMEPHSSSVHRAELTHCGLVTPYGIRDQGQHWLRWWLVADDTKPSPEPMLTDHQWSQLTFILGQFHKRCLNHQLLKSLGKLHV